MRDCVVYKLTATVTVYKSDVESYYEDNDMKYDENTEFSDADYEAVAYSFVNDGNVDILELED